MVWENIPVWFFCMYLSSFPNTISWRGCFPPHFCRKLIAHMSVSLFLSSLFFPIDLYIYFWFSIILFWGPQLHLLLLLFHCHVMSKSFVTSWTVACQAHLSMGFLRQEYQTGLPFPSPGDLPDPGIERSSPESQANFFTIEPLGKTSTIYKSESVSPSVVSDSVTRQSRDNLYSDFHPHRLVLPALTP